MIIRTRLMIPESRCRTGMDEELVKDMVREDAKRALTDYILSRINIEEREVDSRFNYRIFEASLNTLDLEHTEREDE